jgi:hypothetical protein
VKIADPSPPPPRSLSADHRGQSVSERGRQVGKLAENARATDIRAADADRELVVAELQWHISVGRLSTDGFSEDGALDYH